MRDDLPSLDEQLLRDAAASTAHRWSLAQIGRLGGDDETGDELSDHEALMEHARVFGGLASIADVTRHDSPDDLAETDHLAYKRDMLSASAHLTDEAGEPAVRHRAAEALLLFSQEPLP